MNEKEMIEEMAQDLKQVVIQDYGGVYFLETSKELYNLGYRKGKIPKGAVVLTDEEAERFRGQTVNIAKVKSQARKETATEIFEWIKKHSDGVIAENLLNTFFKENYDVEVEE